MDRSSAEIVENRLKLERIPNFVLYAYFLPLSEHETRLKRRKGARFKQHSSPNSFSHKTIRESVQVSQSLLQTLHVASPSVKFAIRSAVLSAAFSAARLIRAVPPQRLVTPHPLANGANSALNLYSFDPRLLGTTNCPIQLDPTFLSQEKRVVPHEERK